MAVISQSVAHDVAQKIAKTKLNQVNLLIDKFNELLVSEYNKTLPSSVVEFYKKMPQYIETQSYIRVTGNGFHIDSFAVNTRVITNKSSTCFEPSIEVAAILLKMYNEYKTERKVYDSLVVDIENALIQLKTYKNIEAQFPDAIKFLPTKSITSVAINLDSILDRLK